jgi:hypothetical protein
MKRPFEGKLTDYGFTWGPCEVVRICQDKKFGVVIGIATPKKTVDIRITPGGRIDIGTVEPRKKA